MHVVRGLHSPQLCLHMNRQKAEAIANMRANERKRSQLEEQVSGMELNKAG